MRHCHCGHSREAHDNTEKTACRACSCQWFRESQNPWSVGVACSLIGLALCGLCVLVFGWPLGAFVGVPAALVVGRVLYETVIPPRKPERCRGCNVIVGEMHAEGCVVMAVSGSGPFVERQHLPDE